MTLAKSLQSAAGNAAEANYIEDVFSTWLYTGTGTTAGSTQTITNGIDLAGEGGMVWIKDRAVKDHFLFDTNRGPWKYLRSNTTDAQPGVNEDALSAFNSNGFTLTGDNNVTQNGQNYASWTFRKQEKFFDVVTYTGNGATNRQIAHNLGSTPGCIIVKCTSVATNWVVYHRSLTDANYCLILNTTIAQLSDSTVFGTAPTSTEFTVARTGVASNTNQNGATYVAYLFAHDAGGFGESGEDNVISCGSFTTDGSNQATVELGYEPQWIITKRVNAGSSWNIIDNMRSWNVGGTDNYLFANLSNAEATFNIGNPTATGFFVNGYPTDTYIYIAIRRGPMKVPESGTSVFSPNIGATDTTPVTTGFPVDLLMDHSRGFSSLNTAVLDRLRGTFGSISSSTGAESDYGTPSRFQSNTSVLPDLFGNDFVSYSFRRAPGFMDVCCYTGTGSARTVAHNLAAVPELMIVKSRGAATGNWAIYTATYGSGSFIRINSTSGNNTGAGNLWGATTPTSSLFYVGEGGTGGLSVSGNNYVAYLFASCPGVSKVGSYTGTGTTQQINCGFTAGARFVLIKRTDSSGDWYVWDSARGIVAGNDPYLLLNSTAAEVTSTDYVDTYSAGFEISSTAPAAINASGGTFIFLAIS